MSELESQDLILAFRVRNVRNDKRIDPNVFARACGITPRRLMRIENGEVAMTMGELRVFADKLKTTPEQLARPLPAKYVPADEEGIPL